MNFLHFLVMLLAIATAFSFGNDISISWKIAICIFLLITNSLDSYTTHLNVKLRGIDAESNAFARALMKKYGLSVVTAYKTIVGLFLGAAAFVMPNAILGIGIVFLWISIHNYVQFLKAKKDLVVDQVVH